MEDNTNKSTKKDVAHSLVKGGLGTIQILGSIVAEIFGLIVTPPLEKRRAEWMNDIAEKLKELEAKQKIDFNELRENEQFIDVILQATTFALKTSDHKKRECFRNTILNTATGDSPNETKSQIFLNQLDRFTTWHIIILDFINSPRNWFIKKGTSPPSYVLGGTRHSLIIETFPELKNQEELLDIIWDDLKLAGYHKTGSLKTMMTGDGVLSDQTTTLGKEFLDFITL